MVSAYALVFVALMTILLFVLMRKKKTNIPGPPFFQALRELSRSVKSNCLHLVAAKWADKYGDVVFVNAIIRNVVFINSTSLTRKLFSDSSTRDISNDRPSSYLGRVFMKGFKDVGTASYGKEFVQRRRLFHKALNFYGEGVHSFEELMTNTSKHLSERLAKYRGNTPLTTEINGYIGWVVGLLLKGKDITQDDIDSVQTYIETGNKLFLLENEFFLETIPSIAQVPGLWLNKLVNKLKKADMEMDARFLTSVRETFKKGEKTGIITDLLEQQKQLEKNGNFTDMSDEIVQGLVKNILFGANLTTAGTLNSLFLQLMVNPKLQERIYAEICEVIGSDPPSFDHKRLMPYTEAVILEALRYSTVTPFLLPHCTNEDINLEGHFIPKGTSIFPNSWYFHHREDLWDKPWDFNPDRFLDANGQLLPSEHPTRQNYLPFGTGRRACPGERFSKLRVFFIFVTLVQQFRFLPPVGEELPSLNPETWEANSVIAPPDYSCRLERRSAAETGIELMAER
ncbi:cytochrome P450 2U1 [Aplysia californica]|uniref:Cytochrome P450 2U1 n=1 Tax=Aplysia californica TaxID=6500 RepID=A0ABM0JVF2_APLCA|nr:cytochrome P450 2U1 [Aplysia californica]